MTGQIRTLALLLAILLMAAPLSGCRSTPAPETTTWESSAPETTTWESSAPETSPAADENRCGTSWRSVFGDRKLPEDGWLEQDQVGFYFSDKDGESYVTVMTVPELLQRAADLGPLPRCRYFHDLLDERYDLLFAAYDMAMALGCHNFAFPTSNLRKQDLTEANDYLYYTFMMYGCTRQYSTTKDLEGPDGETFRFLTVALSVRSKDDMDKHTQAVDLARQIVAEMPEDIDELGRAKYLYEYVCRNVRYDYGDYYLGDYDVLYDALVKNRTVCTGYAEALATLFNLAGIECMYVDGLSLNGGHAWNLAKVNGQWYLFDPTKDETNSQRPFRPYYFGISAELGYFYRQYGYVPFLADRIPAYEGILDPEYTELPPGW
jgi:hypothetical protein